jgi:nucleolar protein 9
MSKVRGRRAQKSQKEEFDPPAVASSFIDENSAASAAATDGPNTFFGLVDTTEIEYFKQAESTLNANAFESDEDRAGFVASVLEESKGKELKLVTNQICSKLIERLILYSNDDQLKQLFKSFNGFFVSLIHHKYASHCVETLLVRSAALIEKELSNPVIAGEDEEFVSIENLFLYFLNEIRPHLSEMITHQYASHSLRLLILIVSGRELPSSIKSNSTLRSKKSKIARKMIEIKDNADYGRAFQTPSSFKEELKQFLDSIRARLDTKKAREMAIDKIGSPVLQLLILVEGLVDRERQIWHLVFDKDDAEKNSTEGAFVEYLLSDPVGSHFFEKVIKDQRLKYVQRLYNLYMSDRIVKLAKRDTTGSYVVQGLLMKLKNAEVQQILDQLIPEMSILMTTNLEMGQSILNASDRIKNYKRDEIIAELTKKYTPKEQESDILESVLQLSTSTLGNTRDDWPTAEERRRALFLEQLLGYDESFLKLTIDNLLLLPKERLIQMCAHGVFSHVVENVLNPEVDIVYRRRLLNQLSGEIADMACNAYGSHIVDKLWAFTLKLNMYKERIAKELFEAKEKVKESTYGRLVWKNWNMELYVRKRPDWNYLIKQEQFAKFPEVKPEVKEIKNDNNNNYKRKFNESNYDSQKKQKIRGRNRK